MNGQDNQSDPNWKQAAEPPAPAAPTRHNDDYPKPGDVVGRGTGETFEIGIFGEEQNDPEYEEWEERQLRMCMASFSGGGSDPYGATCIKDVKYHRDPDCGDAHVGYDPLYMPMGAEDHSYWSWEGGGSCAGDPLPTKNLNVQAYFDEKAYNAYVDYRYAIETPEETAQARPLPEEDFGA